MEAKRLPSLEPALTAEGDGEEGDVPVAGVPTPAPEPVRERARCAEAVIRVGDDGERG